LIVHINGINIFYEKYGQGEPLILLHGNGESHKIFDKAIEILKEHFTIYALDTRGHGQSEKISEVHYSEMVEDVHAFIEALDIKKPILYGFSDGGIIGLYLAAQYPSLLSKLIISGANTTPTGIRNGWLKLFRIIYWVTRDPNFKMMLEEPNISDKILQKIKIPTIVLAGSKDMIKKEHTEYIACNIPNSSLSILDGESHGSYIVHSDKIAKLIIENVSKLAMHE
jgi:pimeloyl-ACP methyl ester carboxylesterase